MSDIASLPVRLRAENPNGLVSLWEMLRPYISEWWNYLSSLRLGASGGATELDPVVIDRVYTRFRPVLESLGLRASCSRLTRLKVAATTSPQELPIQYRVLLETVEEELRACKFLHVPPEREGFYDQDTLFGADVYAGFPDYAFHVLESGNCLALERWTAAVYHLMCVLEGGLDALGNAVKLPPSRKNWVVVLRDIQLAIDALPQGPAEDLEFYRRSVMEFKYFQVAWRNHAAHGRIKYTESEALKVYEHVRDFMQHIATRLRQRALAEDELQS